MNPTFHFGLSEARSRHLPPRPCRPAVGHGLLTGQIRSVDDFPDDDWCKTNPRFTM